MWTTLGQVAMNQDWRYCIHDKCREFFVESLGDPFAFPVRVEGGERVAHMGFHLKEEDGDLGRVAVETACTAPWSLPETVEFSMETVEVRRWCLNRI